MNDQAFHFSDDPAPTPPEKEERPHPVVSLLDYLELIAWSVLVLMLLFILAFRLCTVSGPSMENTLHNGEMLIVNSLCRSYEQDDVIVFHQVGSSSEKTLVKRVVATGGQTVEIDFNRCVITVDGEVYEDTHGVLKSRTTDRIINEYHIRADYSYDSATGIFHATVPEGALFVLGDNRNNSRDSRSSTIGFVDERTVLGRVVLRLKPFTVFS